jgi:outer membrane PBP1 activator LpoA protein
MAARGVPVDGLTGRLTVANDGHVQRDTEWAQVQGGRLQPASLLVPPPSAGEP